MPWFCINTHPKKEQLAATNCINQGFEVFCPSYIHVYPKIGERILPLFPSYIFVQFDPDIDIWYPLCHTLGVKRLFANKPEMSKITREYGYIKPIQVSTDMIESLKQQVIKPLNSKPHIPIIEPGTMVRVTKGHFEAKEGIVAWSNERRVCLLMDYMSGKVEFTFSRDSVELVP